MTPDDAALLVDALGDAFAARDVDAVLEHFAAEGVVIYAGSEQNEVAVGRTALRLLLADLLSRDERYSWHCHSVHLAACAAGATVLADATLHVAPLHHSSNAEGQHHPYRLSGLLEREKGQWRWRMCQGSEPTPTTED